MDKCIWEQDDYESDCWSTTCKQYFSLNEGTPKENGFIFCVFCGKKVEQKEFKEES